MGLSCGAKTAKLLLVVFNAIFFLCGAILIAIGIWVAVDKTQLMELASKALGDNNVVNNQLDAGSLVKVGAYVLIGVGAFNFLVGFCGCCGACTENKCLLGVYACLIGVVMIIEIVGAILAGVYRKDVEAKLQEGLLKLQNQSYVGIPNGINDNPVSLAFDITMITFQCCGVSNYEDFTKNYATRASRWYAAGRNQTGGVNLVIPYSCCILKDKDKFLKDAKYNTISSSLKHSNCGKQRNAGEYYTVGCVNKIKDKIVQYAAVLIGVAVAIILIELFGIVFSCCLMRAIDGEARRQTA